MIGVYREGGKVTHCLLDQSNTQETTETEKVDRLTIASVLIRPPYNSTKLEKLRKNPPKQRKLSVVPFLQTCRTM